MLPLYIVFLLATMAFSLEVPCQKDVEVKTKVFKNADDMVGTWSYLMHWDNLSNLSTLLPPESQDLTKCTEIDIQPITVDLAKEEMEKCGEIDVPFKLEDAKLKMDIPLLAMKNNVIFIAKEGSWILVNCISVSLETRWVSKDIMAMDTTAMVHSVEMFSRKPLHVNELNCLARNVDIAKGMNGLELCF